jgi:hypothetical protein
VNDFLTDYLAGLPEAQQSELARINTPGLGHLRGYLSSGEAVAFLGAGASAPLYPLWNELIGQLVSAAADRLTTEQAKTCKALAARSPEEVVEIVRRNLGAAAYREVLREVLMARSDPESGRSWTATHELMCRCPFKAVITTNYDPGIVTARMHVRPHLLATGFTAWDDEIGMDGWRTGDVFGDVELPVLYAHGLHNRPDSVVLATTEYRRAYEGKLSRVLAGLIDAGHLVWIGFSFGDQRIAAILREVEHWSGTRAEPGAALRHVAIMPWDPQSTDNAPEILAQQAEIGYGARVVLYPAPAGDHSALQVLLSAFADDRFPPVAQLPTPGQPTTAKMPVATPGAKQPVPVTWIPPAESVPHFTGRAEELTRLDRWAADPQVSLVGVTAWGGAGKTSLVTRWVQQAGWVERAGIRGVFGWSFYADPSAEHWAKELLAWAKRELDITSQSIQPAAAVLRLLRSVPLLLVLDGLEVVQESPADDGFGRLLDGTLWRVLSGACRMGLPGQIVLTSRFPFADLEAFDGGRARMLQVPPFTLAEGAALLAEVGGIWMNEADRRSLVSAVDGHALAVGILAALLADLVSASDLASLRAELASATRTSGRVSRVLRFYADRLAAPDRYLVAAVALFARPVPCEAVLRVATHQLFSWYLLDWTPTMVETAVRERLSGLLSWHPDRTISAHPLVSDTFRPLAVGAAGLAVETSLTGLPKGKVMNRADALRVVEAIELLLDADQWKAADDIYTSRFGTHPSVWMTLPASRLGQRADMAFVATPARRRACVSNLASGQMSFHLNGVGLFAMNAGDLAAAREYLSMSVSQEQAAGAPSDRCISLLNLCQCLGHLGEISPALAAANEALTYANGAGIRSLIRDTRAYLAWLAGLNGDSLTAEQLFALANGTDPGALYGLNGCEWAEWLTRTARPWAAQVLTERNRDTCDGYGWNDDVARCDRMLGRLALAADHASVANKRLTAAADCFREGDYLIELAITLTDLAECARVTGQLETADSHASEAASIAAPRGLVPAQSAALAARARIRADRAAALADSGASARGRDAEAPIRLVTRRAPWTALMARTRVRADADSKADPNHQLAQGRDAADAALRLATRHHLPWSELEALRAHAMLDQVEGTDHGWGVQADTLYVRLVPDELDYDPVVAADDFVSRESARRIGASSRLRLRRK